MGGVGHRVAGRACRAVVIMAAEDVSFILALAVAASLLGPGCSC